MRVLSSRCSMLKEMRLLRAPENSRTGMEIRPKVRYPDQTEDAMVCPLCECAVYPQSLNGRAPLWKIGHIMIGCFGNVRQALLFKHLQR